MLNNLDFICLANAWRSKARNTAPTPAGVIEAKTLEKCADQIMQMIHADAIEVKSSPVKRTEVRAS